ncbi:hypothetical protein [Cellulomonas denverensis]|uniref:hypothetical protein n=1 Tax=Cellulomonas denverensis TaxID=264297 RepID=UPI0035EB617F
MPADPQSSTPRAANASPWSRARPTTRSTAGVSHTRGVALQSAGPGGVAHLGHQAGDLRDGAQQQGDREADRLRIDPHPAQRADGADQDVQQPVGGGGRGDQRGGQHQGEQVGGDLDGGSGAAGEPLVAGRHHRGGQHREQAAQGGAQREPDGEGQGDDRGEQQQGADRAAQDHDGHPEGGQGEQLGAGHGRAAISVR